jgi:hypothetical protein
LRDAQASEGEHRTASKPHRRSLQTTLAAMTEQLVRMLCDARAKCLNRDANSAAAAPGREQAPSVMVCGLGRDNAYGKDVWKAANYKVGTLVLEPARESPLKETLFHVVFDGAQGGHRIPAEDGGGILDVWLPCRALSIVPAEDVAFRAQMLDEHAVWYATLTDDEKKDWSKRDLECFPPELHTHGWIEMLDDFFEQHVQAMPVGHRGAPFTKDAFSKLFDEFEMKYYFRKAALAGRTLDQQRDVEEGVQFFIALDRLFAREQRFHHAYLRLTEAPTQFEDPSNADMERVMAAFMTMRAAQ